MRRLGRLVVEWAIADLESTSKWTGKEVELKFAL